LYNYYLYIDLKTKSNHAILEKTKHETKLHYSINFIFHENWSLTLSWTSFYFKISQCSFPHPHYVQPSIEIFQGSYHKLQFETPHVSKSTHLFCFATFLSTFLDIDISFLSNFSNKNNTILPLTMSIITNWVDCQCKVMTLV
jgi:hypothetical protein